MPDDIDASRTDGLITDMPSDREKVKRRVAAGLATYYRHEDAMGWRLPRDPGSELTERSFLVEIKSTDIVNRTGLTQYKNTNTALLGWIAERASGRLLRTYLAEIVDAAGIEGVFHMTTDRDGVPNLEGGVCVTARDLARYRRYPVFSSGLI